jgi:hypothetical protein
MHHEPAHTVAEIGFDDRSADPGVRLQRGIEEPSQLRYVPASVGEVEKTRAGGVGAADMKLARERVTDPNERQLVVYDQ